MYFFKRFAFAVILILTSLIVVNAQTEDNCLCIESETVKKYCQKEQPDTEKSEYRINQEKIAKRDIQERINHAISADFAKDAVAKAHFETEDFTVKELDGKVYKKNEAAELGASANNYQGILKVSDRTKITIECLVLKGNEAVIFTNQHFVRYVPDRKDGSPHEVITNIIHREIWVFTEDGWKIRYVEELERGGTYLDGKPYKI